MKVLRASLLNMSESTLILVTGGEQVWLGRGFCDRWESAQFWNPIFRGRRKVPNIGQQFSAVPP